MAWGMLHRMTNAFLRVSLLLVPQLMNMTNFNRRIRFIQVMAGGIGLGATLIPAWGTNDFWVLSQGSTGVVKAIQ